MRYIYLNPLTPPLSHTERGGFLSFIFLGTLLGLLFGCAKRAPEEPKVSPLQKADAKTFDEALQDYFAGNPKSAARGLFAYVESAARTDENYSWAQYFLGKSLVDLGLRHAGTHFLARIAHERANPSALARALEDLRNLTDLPHDEVMLDEQIWSSIDLGFLPDEISAFAHYQQGLVDLRHGNERWAQSHFSRLPEGSAEASRAKFAILVTRLRDDREKPKALVDQFMKLTEDPKLSFEARKEARLAVARLRYEQKDYQGALEAYEKVQLPPLDPGRASLYLEEAWTRYQLGQIHQAMGLLTTLEAPTFRDEFLPDKYILRSMIYRDLCHYLPAKRAAKELTRRFGDSLEVIQDREELSRDLRLRRAANAHGSARRSAQFLAMLNSESEQLAKTPGTFGDRLYAYLTKLYGLSKAEATRIHDARLREALRAEADKLVRAAEQERLMEYEVGLKLYERVKRGTKLSQPEEDVPPTESEVAFRFEGEYWNDELRDYRFSLKSRCIEDIGP
jgi:hypothetical protein